MRIYKLFLIAYASLIATAIVPTNANAFDIAGTLSKAGSFFSTVNKNIRKKLKENNNSKAAPIIPIAVTPVHLISNDSRYLINEKSNPLSKWILIQIKKADHPAEQVVIRNNDSGIKKYVSLLMGVGTYKISVYETMNESQYSSDYKLITNLEVENIDPRDMSFLLSTEEVQSDDPRIENLAMDITASAVDDMEKTKAIHDYVATLVRYDYDSLIDNKYHDEPTDALTVLDNPAAVCSGYSSLTAALLRALGIRARIVYGKATNIKGTFDHAWNEVYINSEWKSLDVTWDDLVPIRYDYFLPSEANFLLDHNKETVKEYY